MDIKGKGRELNQEIRIDIYTLAYTKQIANEDLAPLMAQTVKKLTAVWETWVQSLGQEDPLEK